MHQKDQNDQKESRENQGRKPILPQLEGFRRD
jgi:hypothetical protein